MADSSKAIELLRKYEGNNPFLLELKQRLLKNDTSILSDFNKDYIERNYNIEPFQVNKTTKIADWYGEKLKEKYDIEFIPEKLLIKAYLGDTKDYYHVYAKWRKSMNFIQLFIPKKVVLNNFLVKDYHDYQIDFTRYNNLMHQKDPNRNLKIHQEEAVQFLLSRKKCVLADDMGLGKAQPIDTQIFTPDGPKKMGEIKIGDYVFGSDGKKHKVLGVYPQGIKDIYNVKFSDGVSTKCCGEHLWIVRDKNMRKRKRGWKVMSLNEMLEKGIHYNQTDNDKEKGRFVNKYEIPICFPVEYDEKKHFIHPYLLGMLLGDGNLCSKRVVISIPQIENESVNRLTSLLNENYCFAKNNLPTCPQYIIVKKERGNKKNLYNEEIKRLSLNVHGNEKFIPQEYLIDSVENRKELLAGLLDSDGSIRCGNKIRYDSKSIKLIKDVQTLVESLGGKATFHIHNREKYGKGIEYYLLIQIKFNPFKLERKRQLYTIDETHHKYCTRYIDEVEACGMDECVCIKVDSEDHSYLTEHYIVTHNTMALSVAAIEGNFDSILIICPASLKTNWKSELEWFVPSRDITIIDSIANKNKTELEEFLGYGIGRSGKSLSELKEEAKLKGKWQDNRFVIINFDILNEFYKVTRAYSEESLNKFSEESPLFKYLYNKKSLIIIDEAHNLSNNTSDRFKLIKNLIGKTNPDSLYLSTGTPITNHPDNYFNLLSLIGDPIASDWEYYMNRYCDAKKFPAKGEKERWTGYFLKRVHKNNWFELNDLEKEQLREYIRTHARMITVAKGESNLAELKEITSHIYLRRVKEDLKSLPKKNIHEIFYDFDISQLMEYNRLWDEYEQEKKSLDPEKELNKELLEGAIYRKYCSGQMVPNTEKMADEFISNGEKVVIMCCYDDELYALRDYYGDKCVIYNGKMGPKEKDKAKSEFMTNPEVMVFIGNIKAAGVGLTLTSAHKMIFNNISFVPGDNQQAMDRVYRIGQTHDVDVYYQMFSNTQYEKMWDTVLKKQLSIDQVIKKEDDK